MFTGIIREIGMVTALRRTKGLIRLSVHAPKTAGQVGQSESVAVNGVCLSVVEAGRESLAFELIPETRRLTNLSVLRPGQRVNLEPSLSLSDRLNGHVVLGHVDGVGRVVKRRQLAGELVLWIQVDRALRALLVSKGSVAVDGVSLTIGPRPTRQAFSIHLIPETLRQTTLASRGVGDRVNIEADYLAKLVRQLRGTGRTSAIARRPSHAARTRAHRR